MAQVIASSIDNEAIDGAFALAVDARFDNLDSGSDQKIFERTSADGTDKIWFGQIGTSDDLEFVVVQDGIEYRTVAKDAIPEGEMVTWRIGIDPDGVMRISNDTEVVAQGIGIVPKDVDRPLVEYGRGKDGEISNLKIANYGNLAELDPTNPDSPCALTGESACLCGLLRPTDVHNEGERGAVVISETDTQGDGEWSNVVALTIIPIHAIVLPDGKVFSFGSTESGAQGGQYVYSLFDPETGVEKVLPNTTGADIFCSNMAIDPNTGNVIIMGGDGGTRGTGKLSGINEVLVFDYKTQTIQQAPQGDLDYARYYGTTVTLASGEIMMIGGRDENYKGATIAEVFNTDTGIRQLTNARMDSIATNPDGGGPESLDGNYWYPHAFVNSKGEVIVIEGDGGDIYRMTTDGAGTVIKVGTTPFADYGLNPSVMYDVDKIAMTDAYGGLWTADISNGTANFVKVAQMPIAHASGSFIPLPDGTVAFIGGAEARNQGNNIATAEKNAMIWNPADNSITEMAEQNVERLYHSSGLMLPDGSIWSGGGGAPGPLINTNVEFFNPAYFYGDDGKLADRPDIESAPTNITAGQTFRITVDDSSDIDMVTAVKSGTSTHARNSDARFVKLDFDVIDAQTIEVRTPDNKIMIPGLWTLHTVDDDGTPSEGSLLGVNMAPLVETPPLEQTTLQYYNIDQEQINGAFQLTVEARFDDLDAGAWQRVFDFGNGAAQDNIFLSQVGTSDDMRFEIWVAGRAYSITAPDAIAEGVRAEWKVSVDDGGYMRMWKDGALVAQGQGAVPADVERVQNYIGDSNWLTDKRLVGEVRNLEIENGNPDPDTPPRVTVASSGDAIEGTDGTTGNLSFVFSLSHATTKDVTIEYDVLGSATGPETVTILAGQKEATVTLSYTGDSIRELDELVTVDIVDVTNARLGSATSTSANARILDDDTPVAFGGSTYRLGTAGLSWEEAQAEAKALGGHLVEINSKEENDFIFQKFGGKNPIWLGFTDKVAEGNFAASDGSALTYSNWLPGEPNDFAGSQDYAIMSDIKDGRWDDINNAGGWTYDGTFKGGAVNQTVIEFNTPLLPAMSITAPADVQEAASGETGTLSYVVSLDKVSAVDVTAKVTIAGAGTGPATVTIPAGQTSATIDVTFQGNDTDNPDQTVTVSLSEIQNAGAGSTVTASARILDDDATDPVDPDTVNVIQTGNNGGYFEGTDGKDDFRGGAGLDVFNGGLGDDIYDGAGGDYNQVDFAGSASEYTFTRDQDGTVTVAHPSEGTDVLKNINGLWFSGEAKWYSLDDLIDAGPPDPIDPVDPNAVNVIQAGDDGGYFTGTDGKDDFRGGAGTDVFNGGLGDDIYDGAGGDYNQVDFAGSASEYTFTRNQDGSVTVAHPSEGVDTLNNIDGLWFSGEAKWYALDQLAGSAPLDPDAVNVIEVGDNGGYFVGTDGKDDFRGGAGNDTFVGGRGDDIYDGAGGGYNQVDLLGRLADYTFSENADGSITASHAEYGEDIMRNIDGVWIGEEETWVSTSDLVDSNT